MMGLRWSSGLVMRRVGSPPWDAKLGGLVVVGSGTKV